MKQLVPKDLRVKITPENKEAIKKRHAEGMSIKSIAELFQISFSTARYILDPRFRQAKRDWSSKNWKRYYSTEQAREIKHRYRTRKRD